MAQSPRRRDGNYLHLLKHTGDACNSAPVAAVNAPAVGCCLTLFLAFFGGLPLLMVVSLWSNSRVAPVVIDICRAADMQRMLHGAAGGLFRRQGR